MAVQDSDNIVHERSGTHYKASIADLKDQLGMWSFHRYEPTSIVMNVADGAVLQFPSAAASLGNGVSYSAGVFSLDEGRVEVECVHTFTSLSSSTDVEFGIYDTATDTLISNTAAIQPINGNSLSIVGENSFKAVAAFDVPPAGLDIDVRVVSGGGAGIDTAPSGSYVRINRASAYQSAPTPLFSPVIASGSLPPASANNGVIQGTTDSGLVFSDGSEWIQASKVSRDFDFSGFFRLRAGQVRGMGTSGPTDQTHYQNWDDVTDLTAGNLTTNAMGGFIAPYDCKVTQFRAIHDNSDPGVEAWGWVIAFQTYTFDSNAEVTTVILNEAPAGVAVRDYADGVKQQSLVTNTASDIGANLIATTTIPEGALIGVAVAAPTTTTDDFDVRVHGGSLRIERV